MTKPWPDDDVILYDGVMKAAGPELDRALKARSPAAAKKR
jgi:hypothetical protein